jgi:diguanylate cyclase (GGDEF)-like protein
MDKLASKGDRLARIAGVWDDDVALSLMQAAPFRISKETNIHFKPVMQAAEVLSSPAERLPKTVAGWVSRLSPEDARERQKAMKRLSWDGAEYKLMYRWRDFQGDEIWLQEHGRRKSGSGDRADEIEGVITNINAQQRAHQRVTYLATHDHLTRTANLDATLNALDHLVALTQRQRGDGALLRLRIKNISDINEIYGFETGDRLIAEFANRLSRIIRAPDVLGRIGGADFGLVLYGTRAEDVEVIAERLFPLIENAPVKTRHGAIFGEICMGSTQIPTQASSAREALAQTDVAAAKAQPSELTQYSRDIMGPSHVRNFKEITSGDILDALNARRIHLAYQPIIHTKTGRLHHYECLLRLQREDGELVSAGQFIISAERLGLVHLLDRRALELASETLRREPNIHLALNVSAGTIQDKGVASEYIGALKALGRHSGQVTLELTETVALDDPATAAEFSNDVRMLGCSFSIDDFGSGHTTFGNLLAIEADTIKIDGTLIEGIASDHNKQTFVRMMVDLAQTFGVETVAEMVDSRADAEILRRLGVDYLQGYMFGVPSTAPSWQKRAS